MSVNARRGQSRTLSPYNDKGVETMIDVTWTAAVEPGLKYQNAVEATAAGAATQRTHFITLGRLLVIVSHFRLRFW